MAKATGPNPQLAPIPTKWAEFQETIREIDELTDTMERINDVLTDLMQATTTFQLQATDLDITVVIDPRLARLALKEQHSCYRKQLKKTLRWFETRRRIGCP